MIVGDFNAKVGKENRFRPTIGPDSLHTSVILMEPDWSILLLQKTL